tara:strand:- start:1310 stop:2785 length:1476 start_codon:yes stop_codon:yes gene_type:complete
MELSTEIFNILKGANIKLKLFDAQGAKTLDPETASRFYAYEDDFLVTKRIENEDTEIVVQAGADFSFDKNKALLDSIKKAGHNAMAEYNVRKFDKNIEPKNFVVEGYEKVVLNTIKDAGLDGFFNNGTLYIEGGKSDVQAAREAIQAEPEIFKAPPIAKDTEYYGMNDFTETVTEAYRKATGTLKSSYIMFPESTRLVIRHTKAVNEEVRGSRSRNIKGLFIENSAGERFRFPYKYLNGAKSMANHVSHGGTPYDAIGESILAMCEEVSQVNQFIRHVRSNKLVNEANEKIVETCKRQLQSLKRTVESLQTVKGYNDYQVKETVIEDNKEKVDIADKFMYNTFENADMNAVLETIARIVKEADSMDDMVNDAIMKLYGMIKNKEDFKLNIDPSDPDHPDNEDPVKYSGQLGALAKLSSLLSYLAMNSKNDEAFNHLQLVGSELSRLPKQKVMLVNKIAMFLDKHYQSPAKEKAPAEGIVESSVKSLRREIA